MPSATNTSAVPSATPPPAPLSDSSALSTEAEGSESDTCDAAEIRRLRRELEREKYRNSQLTAQLKRQTQLQGQLVRLPADFRVAAHLPLAHTRRRRRLALPA